MPYPRGRMAFLVDCALKAACAAVALVCAWVVVSAAVATFTWACDSPPRDSWWRHFKDAFLLAFDL